MKVVWDKCIHGIELTDGCSQCQHEKPDGAGQDPCRLLMDPDGSQRCILGARPGDYETEMLPSFAAAPVDPLRFGWPQDDIGPTEDDDGTSLSEALVVLARLSSACMAQAEWFRNGAGAATSQYHEVAVKWASRSEELLEWVFEEYTPKQLAWELLGLEEG